MEPSCALFLLQILAPGGHGPIVAILAFRAAFFLFSALLRCLVQVRIMLCPCCRHMRQKRDWKPSQWNSFSAVTYQFNCCKVCSPDSFCTSSDEVLEALRDLTSTMSKLKAGKDTWLALFRDWMALPYRIRKDLSYHGGIRIQPGESRMLVHFGAEDTRARAEAACQYHDPGNFIYALAMRLIWPEFWQEGYNQETIGDVFEGILALQVFCRAAWPQGCTAASLHLESYLRQVSRFGILAKDRILTCRTIGDCCRVVVQILQEHLVFLK